MAPRRVAAGGSPVVVNLVDRAVGGAPDAAAVVVGEAPAADGPPPQPRSVRTVKSHFKGQDLRVAVHGGAIDKTRGGLKQDDLMFKPGGTKVISKKKSRSCKQVYNHEGGSPFKRWNAACTQARHDLGFVGRWVPLGGQTADGQRLLAAARALYHAGQ